MINFYGSFVFCVLSITTAGPDYHVRKLRPIRLDSLLQITVSRFIRARHTVILPLGCKTNRQLTMKALDKMRSNDLMRLRQRSHKVMTCQDYTVRPWALS